MSVRWLYEDLVVAYTMQMFADRKFKVINFCEAENMNLLRDSISFEQVALDVNTRRWSSYGQPSFLLSTTLSRELIIVVSSYFLCTFQRRSVIARQRASFCVSALGLSKANLALKVVYRRHYWLMMSFLLPAWLFDGSHVVNKVLNFVLVKTSALHRCTSEKIVDFIIGFELN